MRIRPWVVTGTLVTGALLAGCGSSSSSRTAPTVSPASSAPATAPATSASSATTTPRPIGAAAGLAAIGPAAPSANTVSLAKGPAGIFVVGPTGHSLYVFDMDKGTTSACTGSCAGTWPALSATGAVSVGASVNRSQVGTATGQVPSQVTYYGHLLYYFSGDSAPGQTNGTSIPNWHLLGPFGNVMLSHG